jgi:hypothetical protein
VLDGAIIPDHNITFLPDMLVYELGLDDVVGQGVD